MTLLRLCLLLFLAAGCCVLLPVTGAAQGFDPAPLLHQAATLLEEGRVLQSAAAWEQIYRQSDDPDLRARALVRQGDLAALFQNAPKTAFELYDRALQEYPDSPELQNALFNAAMLRYEMGRTQQARQGFARYLESFPDGGRAQTARYMLERLAGAAPAQPVKPAPPPQKDREPVVRVRLALENAVRLEAPHGGHLLLDDGGYETLARSDYAFLQREGRLWLGERELGRRVVLLPEGGSFRWQGKSYPGEAAVSIHEGRVLLVNRLPLETYLWGVVPAEMPASFAPAALQAQAVAARSYALALLQGRQGKAWDLLASRLSQVFKGVRAGDARIKTAVESTQGQVLEHEGRPLLSYFHSHSGGATEDDAAVWNGDLPFYTVQQDPASTRARKMAWELEVDFDELARALAGEGLRVSGLRGVEVLSRTGSGRLGRLRLLTAAGGVELEGTLLRRALGPGRMKSTLAELESRGKALHLQGRGFGHGVGMSQWGAQGMAKEGATYREILEFYYPGVALGRRW